MADGSAPDLASIASDRVAVVVATACRGYSEGQLFRSAGYAEHMTLVETNLARRANLAGVLSNAGCERREWHLPDAVPVRGSVPGLTVDRFSHDVEMARVSSRLLKHVEQQPSKRHVAPELMRLHCESVQRSGRGDDRARTIAGTAILVHDRLNRVGRGNSKRTMLVPHGVHGLPGEGLSEPTDLDGSQVGDDAEGAQARRGHHRGRHVRRQAAHLVDDNVAVPVQETDEKCPLVSSTSEVVATSQRRSDPTTSRSCLHLAGTYALTRDYVARRIGPSASNDEIGSAWRCTSFHCPSSSRYVLLTLRSKSDGSVPPTRVRQCSTSRNVTSSEDS